MKMVKSLLLGTATGFAMIAGAQAADLPGKAAPAEYVRICDTYGAGFFFIPGTDTCLRIGGFVRADYSLYVPTTSRIQATAGTSVGGSPVPGTNLSRAAFDNDSAFQSRFALNFDARSNTEYGLLRGFAQFTIRRGESSGLLGSGVNNGSNGNPRMTLAVMDRAFIQFAGFTFGYTASFFNFYQGDVSILAGGQPTVTRAHATNLLAYTASFGQGFSATVSLEDRRTQEVTNLDVAAAGTAAVVGGTGAVAATLGLRPFSGLYGLTYGPQALPDVVLNLRVDQGWGSAQLMGAVRQIKDYGYAGVVSTAAGTAPTAAAGDRYGWAIGGGIRINLDQIARGDVLWLQAVYSDGALSYVINNANSDGINANRNNTSGPFNYSQAGGVIYQYRDAIVAGVGGAAPSFATGGSIQTTQAWGIAAGFRHFWTPNVRSSIFGSFANVNAPLASTLPDFRIWTVGANVIWSPVRNLDIGLEMVYGNSSRTGANSGAVATTGAVTNANGTIKSSDANLLTTLRVQRNF